MRSPPTRGGATGCSTSWRPPGATTRRIARLGRDLAAVDAELAAAEERWLELGEALESA